tara:strand:+ start:142 stop:300 length:159 start_codon:yes stop_codon:yes gene_type:complete
LIHVLREDVNKLSLLDTSIEMPLEDNKKAFHGGVPCVVETTIIDLESSAKNV